MRLKHVVKHAIFGPAGARPFRVWAGLHRGRRFVVDPAAKSMRLIGLDETEIARWVRRFAANAATAVDVGANDGWYTLFFASSDHIRRVFAFEPDADLVRSMQENIALNDPAWQQRIEIDQRFIGDRDDGQWRRLDTALLNADEPILIKIDIDGGELQALAGARRTLETKSCSLIIETHSPQLERDCERFLHVLGYRTRIIKNGWYRMLIPEFRPIEQNRWMIATRHDV